MVRNLKTILLLCTSSCLTIVIYRILHSAMLPNVVLSIHNISVQSSSNLSTVSQSLFLSGTSENAITIDRELFNYMALHLRDTAYQGVGVYTRFMTALHGLKPLDNVEPFEPDMLGPVINDVSLFEYPFSISPCQYVTAVNNRRSLFVAVISAPNHFEKRNLIRQMWPNHLTSQTNRQVLDVAGFGFVVGLTNDSHVQQSITEESERYGDILQVNVQDNYRNLSMKVAGLMNWVHAHCSQIDFMLKVDDDVYVNVHNLATILYSLSPSDRSIYGHSVGGGHPDRKEGKWPVSYELWPWFDMPKFFQGAGIVISGRAVRCLLAAIQTTPYFIWDDVYLTGLCAVKAKLNIRSSKYGFFRTGGPHEIPDPCFARNTVLWQTRSADYMNQSHIITHNLYRELTGRCIIQSVIPKPNNMVLLGSSVIYDFATASEFPFHTIMQI